MECRTAEDPNISHTNRLLPAILPRGNGRTRCKWLSLFFGPLSASGETPVRRCPSFRCTTPGRIRKAFPCASHHPAAFCSFRRSYSSPSPSSAVCFHAGCPGAFDRDTLAQPFGCVKPDFPRVGRRHPKIHLIIRASAHSGAPGPEKPLHSAQPASRHPPR